jgi:quinol monooxygenase YgiN
VSRASRSAAQNPPAPAWRFLAFARFTDRAAFDAQMATPHVQQALPGLRPILAKPLSQLFLEAVAGA